MVLELKLIKDYMKLWKYLLIDRLWLPILLVTVLTIDVVSNIIYEVATMPTVDVYPELTIEYVDAPAVEEDVSPIIEYEEVKEYSFENVGYINVSTKLNIRQDPSTESEILGSLNWMDKVQYSIVNDDWAIIQLNGGNGYIASKYIVDKEVEYSKIYTVTGDKAKTYMSYKAINSRTSKQYRLQTRAITDENGLRTLHDRYMVAVGSYFGCKIGQYIDVVLEDGEVLECIVGDAKQDQHTDEQNLHGLNGDTVEFIVDQKVLKSSTKVVGNISDVSEEFDGRVVEVRVYDHIEF